MHLTPRASGVREPGPAARRRHRRLHQRVPVPVTAAVTGVTAALAASACSAPSASHAPSALAAVTSALARTSADSYSFSLDSTVRYKGREVHSDVVSGAFDPGPGLGTEQLTSRAAQHPKTAQVRFIGSFVYTQVSGSGALGRPWDKAPVPPARADGMPSYDVYGFVTDRPVSPAELAVVLRSAGTVRQDGSAAGPGWTGTRYAFTARLHGRAESVSARVYVDQRGRIRRLETIATQGRLTTERDFTFTHFGAPVLVTAPPASQVKYTSTPYWGFLF